MKNEKKTFNIIIKDEGDYHSVNVRDQMLHRLQGAGWELSDKPQCVICVGGDGTVLRAFHKYQFDCTYVGIHTGTLGFFADWGKEEYHRLAEMMIQGEPEIADYTTIRVDIVTKEEGIHTFYSANDLAIKATDFNTLVASLFVNEQPFEVAHGDGIVVSAPCGSTAYNHSLGGAIYHPSLDCMQVNGVAWISNVKFKILNNPMILGRGETLDIYIPNNRNDYVIGIDGKKVDVGNVYKITVQLADKKIKFARYRPHPFWQRVREKLIAGEG